MKSKTDWRRFAQEQRLRVRHPGVKKLYDSVCFDPQLKLIDARFVALDFETTGLNSDQHEIVSIGLVPFTLQRIYLSESQEWLVRPKRVLEHSSVKIHGLTHSQLQQAPELAEVLDAVLNALSDHIVVVHYKYIERDFLYQAVKALTGETLMFPLIDTLSLEDQFHRRGILYRLKQAILGRTESVRLADSRTRYGLPRYPLHSAKIDALATAELFQAQFSYFLDENCRLGDLWE